MNLEGFVVEYGLELTILAFIIIMLIGVLKIAGKKLLDKVTKENRKPIYEATTIVLVILLVVLWIVMESSIYGGAMLWKEFLARALALYSLVKVMYPIYENFKLRDLVQLLGKMIISKAEEKKKLKEGK